MTTALEAAKARKSIPGVNAFANWKRAERLLDELNASGEGTFKIVTARGASSGCWSQTFDAVVLV